MNEPLARKSDFSGEWLFLCKYFTIQYATKVWITKDGKCSLANNNSKLPSVVVKYEVMPRILRLQFMEPQKTAESRA